MVHIHYGVLCLHQKDEYPTFVTTWPGLEEIMLSEISGEIQLSYGLIYLWSITNRMEDMGR